MWRRVCCLVRSVQFPLLLSRLGAHCSYVGATEKEINIYVGLTEMQRKWYRSVLQKDIDAVNGESVAYPPLPPSLHVPELVADTVSPRPDGKEGGQDALDEHGHAGSSYYSIHTDPY